jgi:hypothetical protein
MIDLSRAWDSVGKDLLIFMSLLVKLLLLYFTPSIWLTLTLELNSILPV